MAREWRWPAADSSKLALVVESGGPPPPPPRPGGGPHTLKKNRSALYQASWVAYRTDRYLVLGGHRSGIVGQITLYLYVIGQ
jgi:hypothetical protein